MECNRPALNLSLVQTQKYEHDLTNESEALESVVPPDEMVMKGSDIAITQPC